MYLLEFCCSVNMYFSICNLVSKRQESSVLTHQAGKSGKRMSTVTPWVWLSEQTIKLHFPNVEQHISSR